MSTGDKDETAIVTCGTSTGAIVLELHRTWSPAGYDRAVHLFEENFYDHSHFYRTVPNFLVQFGISYSKNTALQQLAKTTISDDPQLDPKIRFTTGTISYAGAYVCCGKFWVCFTIENRTDSNFVCSYQLL
jgi:peptidyl-prolyl cis-trans isomerase A (cyclophilin A)